MLGKTERGEFVTVLDKSITLLGKNDNGRLRAALFCMGFIAGIALTALSPWLFAIKDATLVILLVVNTIVCAAGISRASISGFRPISLTWFIFSFLWIVVGATYQLSHQVFAWADQRLLLEHSAIEGGLAMVAGANIAFLVGSLSSRGRRKSFLSGAEVRGRLHFWILGACLAVSPIALAANGGIGTLFESRDARLAARNASGYTIDQAGGAIAALSTTLPASLALTALLLFIFKFRSSPTRSPSLKWGLAFSAFLTFVYTNPLSNTRFLSLAAGGSIVLILLSPRSRRAANRYIALLLIAILGLYPVANVFKGGLENLSSMDLGLDALATQDFDGFQQSVSTILLVREEGFALGHHVVSALLYFVPRSVWSGKAEPASMEVAASRNYYFTNLSEPFYAELFFDFGVIGMCFLMFLYGRLCASLDSAWLVDRLTRATVLVPYLALAQIGILRGPLGSNVPVYGTVLILLLLSVRSRSSQTTKLGT